MQTHHRPSRIRVSHRRLRPPQPRGSWLSVSSSVRMLRVVLLIVLAGTLSTSAPLQATDSRPSPRSPARPAAVVPAAPHPVVPSRGELCLATLISTAGLTGAHSLVLPKLYRRYSVSVAQSRSDEFLSLVAAVIFVESAYHPRVVSSAQAYGLMQMTEDAVERSRTECNLRRVMSMTELLDSATNVRYGTCYLRLLLEETDWNTDRALILYNGGYRQLARYDAGQPIVAETANYVLSVHRALRMCGEEL